MSAVGFQSRVVYTTASTPNFPHPSKMSNREGLAKMPMTWAFPGADVHLWNLHEQR